MPLVRIDLMKGKSPDYRARLGGVVYDALTEMGAPKDDRFQLIVEHDADGFVFDRHYLGIERTADLVIVQITMVEGRTAAKKKQLFRSIADGFQTAVGLHIEDVFISLIEAKRENWSFGNGEAQYADTTPALAPTN